MASRESVPPLDGPVVDATPARFRFGRFEFDATSGELRRAGTLVRLRQQPARVLALLLSRPDALVSRDELRAALWSSDTFVDFDQGLNYCVKEIRAAIGDNADAPYFVETLPRRGYRWIGPVERIDGSVEASVPDRVLPSSPSRGFIVAGALLALALAVVALWPKPRETERRWRRVSFRRGVVSSARFGPGGEVAYSASWNGEPRRLYASAIGATEPRLAREGVARLAALSQSGEAYFFAPPGRGTLQRAPLAGGTAKALVDSVLEADTARSGDTIAVARRLGDGKGTALEFPLGRLVARLNAPGALRLSPDGRQLAVIEHPVPNDDAGYVLVFDRDADGARRGIGGEWGSLEGLAWSPRGDEVWVTATRSGADTSVYAIRVADGTARLVLSAGGRLVLHDIDAEGRMLLERATSRPQVFFQREGEPERDLTWLDGSWPADLRKDGSQLLMAETGEGGGPDYAVYLRPTDGSDAVRLAGGRALSFAPDGRSVLVVPAHDADRIEQVPIGAGAPRVHRVPGIASYLWAGLRADDTLFFAGNEPNHNMRVWLQAPGEAPRAVTPEQIVSARAFLSPDGSVMAAACPPRGMCLYATDGKSEPVLVQGLGTANAIRWDASGRELFVSEAEGVGANVFRLDPLSGRRTFVRRLVVADPVGAAGIARILLTPDAHAWAYAFLRRLSELYVVEEVRP
jgi:DNA-binding winged helix-turn-helix (wHTH) protein